MAQVCIIIGAPWDVVMGMTLQQMYAIVEMDNFRQARTLRHNLMAGQGSQSKEGFEIVSNEIERLSSKTNRG